MKKTALLSFLLLASTSFSSLDEDFLKLDKKIPITSLDPEIYTYTHDGSWTLKKHSEKGDVVIEMPFVEKTGVFTKQEWGHVKTLALSSALISSLISMIGVVSFDYFSSSYCPK